MAWPLGLSKGMVLETDLASYPDSVYLRNFAINAVRVESISLKLPNAATPDWEFSLRSNRAPKELCFGKGLGVCPPVDSQGSFKTEWMVPAGDSLLLSDFNLAECIRCPLMGGTSRSFADTVVAALVIRTRDMQDTLWVRARFGGAR